MRKELFIIRHGETDYNLQGIVQGRGVDPSLNETGRWQAQSFFNCYQSENFDIIYTSTLRRTHETVNGFLLKGIKWQQSPDLDEISWGIFEGQLATHNFKKLYRDLINSWNNGHLDKKAPDGESPVEVQYRQTRFLHMFKHQPYQKILICMHGRAMRILLPTMLQKPLQTMNEYPHHNLSLYKLTYHQEEFKLELFNSLGHLHQVA